MYKIICRMYILLFEHNPFSAAVFPGKVCSEAFHISVSSSTVLEAKSYP